MKRIILQATPGKICPSGQRRESDREDVAKLFLSLGIQQVSIEAEDAKLIFVFDIAETAEIENKMLSGEVIMVPWQGVLRANSTWKDALALLKDKRR